MSARTRRAVANASMSEQTQPASPTLSTSATTVSTSLANDGGSGDGASEPETQGTSGELDARPASPLSDIPGTPPPPDQQEDGYEAGDGTEGIIRLPDWSDTLWQRVLAFLDYKVITSGRYSVAEFPKDGDWGSYSPRGGNRKKILRDSDDKVTLKVYMLGLAKSVWICDQDGMTRSRINIGIQPIRHTDLDAAKTVLSHYAEPKKVYSDGDLVWANKRMVAYRHGKASITPFDEVYDATSSFGSKSNMRKMPARNLGRNDLVLVEATVTRWRINDGSDSSADGEPTSSPARGARPNPTQWLTWKTGFELQSIALLREGEADESEDESEGEVDEI